MPAQIYRIRDVGRLQKRSRRIRESGGPWFDAERQECLQLKTRIEGWIEQQSGSVLYRRGRRVDHLSRVRFHLLCLVNRLVLNYRIRGVDFRARVLRATQDDLGSIVLHTHLAGQAEIFEIRTVFDTFVSHPLQETRTRLQKIVEHLIVRNFPKAQILRSVVSQDLEHSLSRKYVRLQFRAENSRWVAIACGPSENQATIDGVLGSGVLWRDLLRQRGLAGQDRLLLLAPREKLLTLRSRLAWISGAGNDIQLMGMDCDSETLTPIDLSDSGNVDTAFTHVQTFLEGNRGVDDERVKRVLALAPGRVTCSRPETGKKVVFRIRGREIADLQLDAHSGLFLSQGTPGVIRSESDWERLKDTVEQILAEQDSPRQTANSRYAPHPERWLESLLLSDIQAIDATLDPRFVYPQVPAYLAGDRGMIDILSITRDGRLAILELKVSEDMELPMQGLDYWLRVRWHHSRNEFQTRGYFPGVLLSPLPPLLFFVCPQFRYHSSFPLLTGQINPALPLIQIGINENWREGVRVVLRRVSATLLQ